MKKVADGIALFRKYSLFEVTGEVESETTRSETEVRGEAGNPGNGPLAGRITSKTTRYQTIYLKDDDGGQYAVELVDFVIPCREGHKLTVRGADKRLWFDVDNLSTGQGFENGSGLAKYAFPDRVVFGGAIVAAALTFLAIMMNEGGIAGKLPFAVLGGLIVGAIIFGVLWMPGRIIASMRAAQMRGKLKQMVSAYAASEI